MQLFHELIDFSDTFYADSTENLSAEANFMVTTYSAPVLVEGFRIDGHVVIARLHQNREGQPLLIAPRLGSSTNNHCAAPALEIIISDYKNVQEQVKPAPEHCHNLVHEVGNIDESSHIRETAHHDSLQTFHEATQVLL